jgi:hypothetical protein
MLSYATPPCHPLLRSSSQADNTVRENRNQWMMLYMAALCRRHFNLTSLAFLRKSHTHDRPGAQAVEPALGLRQTTCSQLAPTCHRAVADQLWGILARRLATETSLLHPDDAIRCIKHTLNLPTVRAWLGKNTITEVSKMDAVHDWRNHLPLFMVGLEGGMLVDATSNHLFVMMRRRGAATKSLAMMSRGSSHHLALPMSPLAGRSARRHHRRQRLPRLAAQRRGHCVLGEAVHHQRVLETMYLGAAGEPWQ